ncbi:hypothetical protein, partial [Dactylosporangium darangshiense]|uniref:hypothetical protein n=1 Tax=Dactylosporangium darangshiense TaxID=579108 RepID=UPI0031EFB4FA
PQFTLNPTPTTHTTATDPRVPDEEPSVRLNPRRRHGAVDVSTPEGEIVDAEGGDHARLRQRRGE